MCLKWTGQCPFKYIMPYFHTFYTFIGSDRDFHAPWGGPDEGPGSYLGPDHFDAPDQLGKAAIKSV